MNDSDKILKSLPKEVFEYISTDNRGGKVVGDKKIEKILHSGHSKKNNQLLNDWTLLVNMDKVSKFNLDALFEKLKKTEKFVILALSPESFNQLDLGKYLVIYDFFMCYKYFYKDEFVVVIFEKYHYDSLNLDNKYFFKYNKEADRQSCPKDFDRFLHIIVSNNYELESLQAKSKFYSVQLVLKLRDSLSRRHGYKTISKILYKLLKGMIKLVKVVRSILKLPSILKGKINDLFLKRRVNNLKNFIEIGDLIVIYAGVRFVDNEGQRSVRLAQEFVKKGRKVLYIYWDYSPKEWNIYGKVSENLYLIPRSQFLKLFKLTKNSFTKKKDSTLLIHVSDMEIAKLLPEFTSMGFYTVYDILDDWSEFAKRGQATWYEEDVENFILRNVYKRYAVSQGLIAKHSKYDIEFLPNGFTAQQLTDSPKVDLEKGKINLGYFGHLTKEWFDWNLVLAVANKYPDVFIHVIGYGFPEGLQLPDNVKYYGKLLPSQLSGYTKNWDVCLIPFQDIELSKSVNPIKVYEYLYLGKPVVVTGIPGLDKFPYVYFSANDVDSFMKAVHKAMDNKVDYEKVSNFLKKNRWEDRAEIILSRK